MSATAAKNERINLRLKQSAKRLIERAASFEGQTVSNFILSSALAALPKKVARKLPKHPIPAVLIGRLAVDLSMQGQGVGQVLLANAIKRTLAVAKEIGIYAMVVEAISKDAECFYAQYGFTHLAKDNRHLFLQLKSL